MADKPIRLRSRAADDLSEAAGYYEEQLGGQAALRFIDDVQASFGMISSSPGIGSLRYSYDLDIPGLRAWPIAQSELAIFYVETDDHVDVWRILHTHRDMSEAVNPPDI